MVFWNVMLHDQVVTSISRAAGFSPIPVSIQHATSVIPKYNDSLRDMFNNLDSHLKDESCQISQ
jgi:hypothetical protein